MKKFFFVLLTFACCFIAAYAENNCEYVKYGGGLELIVKTETHLFKQDTKTYGIRKNGIEIINPEYGQHAVVVANDLSLLAFMCEDTGVAHIYNIENGKEVFTYRFQKKASNSCEYCVGFSFNKAKVNGINGWQLIETVRYYGCHYKEQIVVAAFYRKNGKVCQQKTKTVTYEEELY